MSLAGVPDLPGVLSADEARSTGEHLATLQTASGMIPWWPGGHCDRCPVRLVCPEWPEGQEAFLP